MNTSSSNTADWEVPKGTSTLFRVDYLRCSKIAWGLFVLNIWKSVKHKKTPNLKTTSKSGFCQCMSTSLPLVLCTDGTWSLDFEPDSDVTMDILPTQSPTSGKAQRLILSTCLKPIEVEQIFRYRCGKHVYGCCWTRALNALTVCHLMLLANNTLHFGSAKNNNKIVVL